MRAKALWSLSYFVQMHVSDIHRLSLKGRLLNLQILGVPDRRRYARLRPCALAERPQISSNSKNHLPIAKQCRMHTGQMSHLDPFPPNQIEFFEASDAL